MEMTKTANSVRKSKKKTRKSPWSRLKISLSKNLFNDSLTEVRTMQNEVIGMIETQGMKKFQASNYRNEKVQFGSFEDSKTFILSTYFLAGRPDQNWSGMQLNMF